MKILLTGKNGQAGWELQQLPPDLGELVAVDLEELDLADTEAIRRAVREIKPAVIINAAAYTAVDRAETEPELAMAVNAGAPGVLAEEAARLGAVLVHYSTDYVFDGGKRSPYLEDDPPNPLSVYGESKLAGEKAIRETGAAHLIFRTSWIYGMRGNNFLLTILRLAREREELSIVDDQFGAPNWCRMIAQTTVQILQQEGGSIGKDSGRWGIYNLVSSGITSWYNFAREILAKDPRREEQICKKIVSIKTEQFPTPAKRPLYSVLNSSKIKETFGVELRSWDSYLEQLLRQA